MGRRPLIIIFRNNNNERQFSYMTRPGIEPEPSKLVERGISATPRRLLSKTFIVHTYAKHSYLICKCPCFFIVALH